MQALEKRMADIQQRFERTHASYESLISSDEERRLHDSFKSELAQSMNGRQRMLALSRRNANDEARQLLEGESQKSFVALTAGRAVALAGPPGRDRRLGARQRGAGLLGQPGDRSG